jgi:hypothetical protein
VRKVHRCRVRRSSGKGRSKSDGEGHDRSTRSRRPRHARGVVEREEDGLLHWHGGDTGWRSGGTVECAVAEESRACGGAWSPRRHGCGATLHEVSFFHG